MADNNLEDSSTLQPAPRGSKLGWPIVSGQVPPEVEGRLGDLARKRRAYVSDLIREAVEQYLARELERAA